MVNKNLLDSLVLAASLAFLLHVQGNLFDLYQDFTTVFCFPYCPFFKNFSSQLLLSRNLEMIIVTYDTFSMYKENLQKFLSPSRHSHFTKVLCNHFCDLYAYATLYLFFKVFRSKYFCTTFPTTYLMQCALHSIK